MNLLEQMGYIVRPIRKVFTPFKAWEGTEIKDWTVTLELLTLSDQIDVARNVAEDPPTVLGYTTKLHILAKALKAINGEPIVTEEQLLAYRTEHQSPDFTAYDYVLLFLKKLSEHVVSTMVFAYDQLQDAYAEKLLGKPLPDALKVVKADQQEDTQQEDIQKADNAQDVSDPTSN